jgi:catechol 2,3-dioxygenase-like lactoylglutathione lyase family enzyme
MKRFHVHLHVDDLAKSIAFYNQLFRRNRRARSGLRKVDAGGSAGQFRDFDPRHSPGIDHLGIQTDDPAELAAMKARAEAADMALLDEGSTTCCYARSEKHWVTDPQGIAWEHFHTLGNIPVFNEAALPAAARHRIGMLRAQGARHARQAARHRRQISGSGCC